MKGDSGVGGRIVAALALCLLPAGPPALAMTAEARAQAIAPAAGGALTPERQALGEKIAHVMLSAIPLQEIIVDSTKKSLGSGLPFPQRPEWTGYLIDALTEEVLGDPGHLDRVLGRHIASNCTLEELQAGLVIMSDPFIQQSVSAETMKTAPPSGQPGREAERAGRSPSGQAFLKKLAALNSNMDTFVTEFVGEISPGMLRRFADKIEAGERARRVRP